MMKSVLFFFHRIKECQVEKDIKKIMDVDSGQDYTSNTYHLCFLKLLQRSICVSCWRC